MFYWYLFLSFKYGKGINTKLGFHGLVFRAISTQGVFAVFLQQLDHYTQM
jgi:hypothetical protein